MKDIEVLEKGQSKLELSPDEAQERAMRELRRELHRYPELSWQEKETAALLRERLSRKGLRIRPIEGSYGFVAVLDSGREGPVSCFRTDIDALAVHEDPAHEPRSEFEGRMHACGHDFHMAALTILAETLVDRIDALKGKILFLYQPAEESADGAAFVLKSGVLQEEGCEAVFGGHVWDMPVGRILCRKGAVMASSDIFHIEINGRGGHGALPHMTRDPITAAAALITAFQTLAARRHSPFDPLALSICSIHGGESYNIVPDCVQMEGTMRGFSPDMRFAMLGDLKACAEGIAGAFGVEIRFERREGPDSVRNDEALVEAAWICLGQSERIQLDRESLPAMVSEDFSYLSEMFPGLFFLFGASCPDGQHGGRCLLHQSVSDPDEGALDIMLETYLRLAGDRHLR